MDYHLNRLILGEQRIRAAQWVKEWVPQTGVTGKKIWLLKWVKEDLLKDLKEKFKEPEQEQQKPEPTTEILFLCSYVGCHKAFLNEGAYRKHVHVHGERQYICSYPDCGKKFFDNSKLKRHKVIRSGEKIFVCLHEGCNKRFNMNFNLKAHMKTHSKEYYHVCPYPDCERRFMQENKLKSHITAHHEKKNIMPKTPSDTYASPSPNRPYVCPYQGCGKNYIYEYKLNNHLRTSHPIHNMERYGYEPSDQDEYIAKGSDAKNSKRTNPDLMHEMPPSKIPRQISPTFSHASVRINKQSWLEQEDSEETEEERENFHREVDSDDEETEDEL